MSKLLVVVDVQFGAFFGPWALPAAPELLTGIGNRILEARNQGQPIMFIQNDGGPEEADAPGEPIWQLVFAPTDQDLVVNKTSLDVFESNPGLAEALQQMGLQTLEFVGAQSELCVRSSALGAIARGFQVELAPGLHGTYDGGWPGATEGPSAGELIASVEAELAKAKANHV